jgi:hypothetical protein
LRSFRDLEPPSVNLRMAGYREAGSERLEENHRVVINGSNPEMNRSAKDGAWSSPHYGTKAHGFHSVAPRCVRATRWGRTSLTQEDLVSSEGKVWLE